MNKVFVFFSFTLLAACPSWGHGFSGSGLLHPLTGTDHMLAMVAIGAWSAQLGGKAIYYLPSCFLLTMLLGGLLGVNHLASPYVDGFIAISVLLLGFTIAIDKRFSWLGAGPLVGLFGLCHGLAHGLELTQSSTVINYIAGFLLTTAGLHVVGAVGGLLILDGNRGRIHLRVLGLMTGLVGFYLLSRFIAN